jgi:hypothetical protein
VKFVGVGSVRGAPGTTACSLLLTSALAGPAVLVEADLHGGVLAVRYGLGREPGLTTLAASSSGICGDGWCDYAQAAGGVAVIVGPEDPDRAASLWDRAGGRIARALASGEGTGVVDLGRLSESPPLSGVMSLLLILVAPQAEQLVTLSRRLPALRRHAGQLGVVLAGDGDYRPGDVAESMDVEVLGVLPRDDRAGEALLGRGRGANLGRTRLYRATAELARSVDAALGSSVLEAETVS